MKKQKALISWSKKLFIWAGWLVKGLTIVRFIRFIIELLG